MCANTIKVNLPLETHYVFDEALEEEAEVMVGRDRFG